MASYILPVSADGGVTYTLNLNTTVKATFKFNYRVSCWTMDLLDVLENPIVMGIMLVPEINLLSGHLELIKRLGNLIMVEQYPGAYKEPDSLGNTLQLVWVP